MKKKPLIGITMEMSPKRGQQLNFLDLAYGEAVERAGGKALFLPSLPLRYNIEEIISIIDGLLLTGGADINPAYYGEEIEFPITLSPDQRTDYDLAVCKAAISAGKAILSICHGLQLMNVAWGGTLFQDLPSQLPHSLIHWEKDNKPARHLVTVEPGSRLANFVGGLLEFEVSSTHHQAIKDLGKGLAPVAHAPDGIIEGVEIPGHSKIIGVQWHPEKDFSSQATQRLFASFIKMATS